jgi:hypothetical protein
MMQERYDDEVTLRSFCMFEVERDGYGMQPQTNVTALSMSGCRL